VCVARHRTMKRIVLRRPSRSKALRRVSSPNDQSCSTASTIRRRGFSRFCSDFRLVFLFIKFGVDVDDTKCIVVTRVCVCVCLSTAACLHYCTDPDVTWGVVGNAPSCELLGGFAIGARVGGVALLWQHNTNAKC